jgi:transcriptional regulator with XRE-family HTH domain
MGSGNGDRDGIGGGSVVHRRILGRRLRLMREEAGLTLEEAAPKLDWSTSTLSRIESGQQAPTVHGVRSMVDIYDIGGDHWGELITMTREVRQKGWWRAYGVGDNSYVGFESEANRSQEYTLLYFPGLLQTPEYTRALFAASGMHRTSAEMADDISVRAIRQQRLTSEEHPLELVAIVDEAAVHRQVGGPDVMLAQLQRVIDVAALPSVTFQVLPASAGAHPAMASTLILLSFDHLGEPDIAYVEHSLGATQFEKAADLGRARIVFERLRSAALDPERSLACIREVVAQLEEPGGARGSGPSAVAHQ